MCRYFDLVSIVVPVYNVEEYLIPCIDSILKQTYENLEIILVDDGSTDRSGEICEKYKEKDTRIKVFHKQNGGLSDARNFGMKQANAKFITFIDSDDTISPNFISVLLTKLKENNADIVQCRRTLRKENLDAGTENEYLCSGQEGLRQFLLRRQIDVFAWGKLYKRELFQDIEFPYGRINEDVCTTYKLLYRSEKIVCLDLVLYWHRMREGSILHSPICEKNFEILKTTDEIKDFLGGDAKHYVEEIDFYNYKTVLILLNALLCSAEHNRFPDQRKYLREKILSVSTTNRYLSVKDKILIQFVRMSPFLYKSVIRSYRRLMPHRIK